MRKHRQSDYQQITAAVLNRISSLTDRRLFDFLMYRLLHSNASGEALVDGVTAYFPLTDCMVELVSGDRATGVTFRIRPGLGVRKFSTGDQPDTDLPNFQPVVLESEQTFVTTGSNPTNPRIDRVFLKPVYADGNAANVNIIDPNPPNNITSESRARDRIYSYLHAYVAGTPAPSPVAPAAPSGFTNSDAIAEILIIQGSGAFNPAQLTDLRTLFEINNSMVPSITVFPADQVSVVPDVLGQSEAQAALEALAASIAANAQKGLLDAVFERFDTTTVRLSRKTGSDIRVEIDGAVLSQSGSLDFVLPTHLETGSEEASTRYYCYVQDVASVMTPRISVTPPVVNPSLKMGYHPTQTSWRCVGSFFNDASSNVLPFRTNGRWLRFTEKDAAHFYNPGSLTSPKAWTSQALTIPIGARAVQIQAFLDGNDNYLCFGSSDVVQALPATNAPHALDETEMGGVLFRIGGFADSVIEYGNGELPIADPAAPAIKWGIVQVGTTDITDVQFRVLAYYDPHLPA